MKTAFVLPLLAACSPIVADGSKDGRPDADSGTSAPVDTDPAPSDDTAAPDAPPRALHSGSHDLEHDGRERRFRLYLPSGLEPGAPLIVALHGYGSSADVIEGYAQLNALADRQQVAVVYPEASRAGSVRCWNVGYCGNDDVDDVGFVRTVVELVRTDQGLGRAYMTGMSNGGDMTYRLACEAPALVAAAASVTGCMMSWLAESCSPDPVPPVLHIHGNADRTTLWDGDPDYTGGGYLGTLDSVGVFAGLHGANQYESTTISDPDDGSAYISHHWRTESGAAPVRLLEIDGGRHRWPTNSSRDDFSAADMMWEFFTATR